MKILKKEKASKLAGMTLVRRLTTYSDGPMASMSLGRIPLRRLPVSASAR